MHRSVLMEPRTLQSMAEAMEGQWLSGSPETLVNRVCTDSRQLQSGDLFVALKGERFDGHTFAAEAATRGASALVLERASLPPALPDCPLIAVENTRRALGKLAARHRRDFRLPLIAVAGSNGKTTTKDLIASVLRQKFRTLASPASFNNDIGVPMTLLDLAGEHEVAVLELGTNHPGELAGLLELAQPQYGVIPSIGREHLAYFGDLDGVIREEGTLAELLPVHGKLFLNGDTAGAGEIMQRSAAPVVRVGFAPGSLWRVEEVRFDQDGARFMMETTEAAFCREFRVPLLGRHQAINAALAIAVGAELGLSADEIQRGLESSAPPKMRLQLWNLGEVQILDDSYNANADSMRAALETLRDFPCRGRRVAVLADMAELGSHAEAAHQEVGAYAASLGIEELLVLGKMAAVTAAAARGAGLELVSVAGDVEAAAAVLSQTLRPGDLVLFKGSRAAKLERLGELLRKAGAESEGGAGPNWLGNG